MYESLRELTEMPLGRNFSWGEITEKQKAWVRPFLRPHWLHRAVIRSVLPTHWSG